MLLPPFPRFNAEFKDGPLSWTVKKAKVQDLTHLHLQKNPEGPSLDFTFLDRWYMLPLLKGQLLFISIPLPLPLVINVHLRQTLLFWDS